MREELKENIRLSIQKTIPFVLSLVFVLFNYVPSNLGYPNIIRPEIGCICVFYWVLYRPDLFNMVAIFFLGFVSDVISSAPLGINIISFLVIYLIVSNKFSFFNSKPFNVIWFCFALIILFVEFIKWLLVSVYYAKFIPLGILFFTVLFTIACYPVISFVNESARKYLMNDEG